MHEGEADAFYKPDVTEAAKSVFEHCALALDQAIALSGAHGLPLMGTGDWNDGMNRVGAGGKGESVWLAWFLIAAIDKFVPLVQQRDRARAERWRAHRETLRAAIEREAWDGDWYRRAWFDDGTPLGSRDSEECQIDSIAQSWAVLSGAAEPARRQRAMEAVQERLVPKDSNLVLLFTPPFDEAVHDPGYVKGYPPGLRENGGQYTHAATWVVLAEAKLGHGGVAGQLFDRLNPINHARTAKDAALYRVEPFVVAGDVYSVAPNVGRGGWTWYTGSAAWLYRAGIEGLLGVQMHQGSLIIDPSIPPNWPEFRVKVRHGAGEIDIWVQNPEGRETGVAEATLDGSAVTERPPKIPLDGRNHLLQIRLG